MASTALVAVLQSWVLLNKELSTDRTLGSSSMMSILAVRLELKLSGSLMRVIVLDLSCESLPLHASSLRADSVDSRDKSETHNSILQIASVEDQLPGDDYTFHKSPELDLRCQNEVMSKGHSQIQAGCDIVERGRG